MMVAAFLRRVGALAVCLGMLAACSSRQAALVPDSPGALSSMLEANASGPYATTLKYVVEFYPLWFYTAQSQHASVNQLIGPDRISPVYRTVVAINDDTLYASTFVDVSKEPLILTVPSTRLIFSVAVVDMFGDIFDTGISGSGVYGFTGPGWNGTLPSGVTQVALPDDFMAIAVRSDKYSPSGANQKIQSQIFRKNLRATPLSEYGTDPQAGATHVIPVAFFGIPYKQIADDLATKHPIEFLTMLQQYVAASSTPPLSTAEQALSARFNAYFNAQNRDTAAIESAARAAHQKILDYYLNHTGKTSWIDFVFNGNFNGNPLLRSAIAEFIQVGNDHATAAYYQAFKDGKGVALDGSSHAYVLTFAAGQTPQAKRFWSVTAYVPNSIELHRNSLHKYLVGSYTPGLQKARNGSISIYMAPQQPKGVPTANWLPVPKGPFNVMLRVYGPEGSVKTGTYVPPAIGIYR
ncbi:MAG TPA: DUF1214 domain-containing protein [Candidatus Baltobacteraceae bacterium]|nr:DUF1214 domain-containing protein [Candidatus Baltobacteraceae bacterium]